MHAETQPRDPSAPPEIEETSVAEGQEAAPKSRSLAPLRMVFGTALQYPREIALALVALIITSAATLAIPYRFKVIIDKAFTGGADPVQIGHAFQYLLIAKGFDNVVCLDHGLLFLG